MNKEKKLEQNSFISAIVNSDVLKLCKMTGQLIKPNKEITLNTKKKNPPSSRVSFSICRFLFLPLYLTFFSSVFHFRPTNLVDYIQLLIGTRWWNDAEGKLFLKILYNSYLPWIKLINPFNQQEELQTTQFCFLLRFTCTTDKLKEKFLFNFEMNEKFFYL